MARHDAARYVSREGVDPAKIAAISALKNGVHYRVGSCRPYRPMPSDFAEMYVRLGWGRALTDHYRTNDRCILRWIEQCGGGELRAKRSAVTGMPYTNRRSRYPTYEQAVAAILRGDDVPAIVQPPRKPSRPDKPLFDLALDRGYRVRRGACRKRDSERMYYVRARIDLSVRGIGPNGGMAGAYAEVMAWLEPQPPVQW